MKWIDTRGLGLSEISKLLPRKPFDEIALYPEVQEQVDRMWGEHLTADEVVHRIVHDVRYGGDKQLIQYTRALDCPDMTVEAMRVTESEFDEARTLVHPEVVYSIEKSISNIKHFHEEQLPKSWFTTREHGSILGQMITPVDSVGIYVPGGTASYLSSVIMNAVPARVAAVPKIVMAAPPGKDGKINPYVLLAAEKIGIREIYKMGGAQAIAALAFGTETIPSVAKITGAGNIFVTLAKKAVFGYVDIDMLAGPSETMIIADSKADAEFVAADMLSQAEHDPLSTAVLVTDSISLCNEVKWELEQQLRNIPRIEIAGKALENNCCIVLVDSMKYAVDIANMSGPGHLAVMTEEATGLLPFLRNCGAVFIGKNSPEALGDYFAGPNHILPTGGTARFYSSLNVDTFMKKSSIISYSRQGLEKAAEDIINLAEAEGLRAHAEAVRKRINKTVK